MQLAALVVDEKSCSGGADMTSCFSEHTYDCRKISHKTQVLSLKKTGMGRGTKRYGPEPGSHKFGFLYPLINAVEVAFIVSSIPFCVVY